VPSTYSACLVNIERSAGQIDDGRHDDAPEPRPVERLDQGRVVETPMVGGLHHRDTRQAA
jgi:hypothetical protein